MMRLLCVVFVLCTFVGRAALADDPPPVPQFGETMEVVRYLVEVRVTDAAGRPVSDLPADDFEVTIGKARAHVEAADWISFAAAPAGAIGAVPGEPAAAPAPDGRLVVFFVQTDFARNASRIKGHMRFTAFFAERVVGMLQPGDRIAVFAFDSHLKLLRDFTTDHEAVLKVLRESLDTSKAPVVAAASKGVSLVPFIDAKEAKSAARGEEALLLVARALSRIEGNKMMFLAGWGFGDVIWGTGGGSQVVLPRELSEAVGLLHRNRTPVVTIGTGGGQLTTGIALTARATGGMHTSALASFPEQQLTRLEGFVAGRYELVIRTDEPLAAGEYPITVTTKDPRHRVQTLPSIVIDIVDTRYGDAVALINAGLAGDGVRVLRESMAGSSIPADVLVERLRALVDAAQWDAALVVVERLEAEGAVDGEVAPMVVEARRGASLQTKSAAHARLVGAKRLLLDGDADGALRALDEAVAIDPALAGAWYERGMLLLAGGRTDDAAASLRRYLELEPHGANAATAREMLASLGGD